MVVVGLVFRLVLTRVLFCIVNIPSAKIVRGISWKVIILLTEILAELSSAMSHKAKLKSGNS